MGIRSFIWYTGRDSNPQPSEPESDALSIEPPVHASQPDYYSKVWFVCKEVILAYFADRSTLRLSMENAGTCFGNCK